MRTLLLLLLLLFLLLGAFAHDVSKLFQSSKLAKMKRGRLKEIEGEGDGEEEVPLARACVFYRARVRVLRVVPNATASSEDYTYLGNRF